MPVANTIRTINLALKSLMLHKLRSGLTMLGIVFGVFSVIAMLAIGDMNGGAVRMHAYAQHLTIATQLARGKMLDIQQILRKDGLSDFSKEYHGTFEDEGEPTYKWRALVIKPEIVLAGDATPEQVALAEDMAHKADNYCIITNAVRGKLEISVDPKITKE